MFKLRVHIDDLRGSFLRKRITASGRYLIPTDFARSLYLEMIVKIVIVIKI